MPAQPNNNSMIARIGQNMRDSMRNLADRWNKRNETKTSAAPVKTTGGIVEGAIAQAERGRKRLFSLALQNRLAKQQREAAERRALRKQLGRVAYAEEQRKRHAEERKLWQQELRRRQLRNIQLWTQSSGHKISWQQSLVHAITAYGPLTTQQLFNTAKGLGVVSSKRQLKLVMRRNRRKGQVKPVAASPNFKWASTDQSSIVQVSAAA